MLPVDAGLKPPAPPTPPARIPPAPPMPPAPPGRIPPPGAPPPDRIPPPGAPPPDRIPPPPARPPPPRPPRWPTAGAARHTAAVTAMSAVPTGNPVLRVLPIRMSSAAIAGAPEVDDGPAAGVVTALPPRPASVRRRG